MIKARIYRKNQKICGFEISGHAGYAQAGEDIVCSAVTVLCFNTVNAVENSLTSHSRRMWMKNAAVISSLVSP